MSQGSNSSGRERKRRDGPRKRSRVKTRSLISERESQRSEVDQTLTVLRDFYRQYNDESIITDAQIATLSAANADVIAYYDGGGNIAVNERYFDTDALNKAYDGCVERGFHPKRGKKTGIEATVAHEMGHKMTDAVAQRMGYSWGFGGIDTAAERIVKVAAIQSGYKGKKYGEWAGQISGYAKQDMAEAVAEAVSDVYCNGKKAKKRSRAIVDVLNYYMK